MIFNNTDFSDLILIETDILKDSRGSFTKTFNVNLFLKNKLDFKIMESYYSISSKNVIRGMHFQTPPFEHNKLIYVTKGKILDIVLDIRKESPTFGKCYSTILSEENRNLLYIPIGFAHGFKALENDSCIVYNQSTVYSAENDSGILYNSIEFDWEIKDVPIISKRDLSFKAFKDFISPF